MSEKAILNELSELKKLVLSQGLHQKSILNFKEAAQFVDLSHSYLYKLTCKGEIPFYKPQGKKIWMRREDLEKWLLRNRVKAAEEVETEASTYVAINSKKINNSKRKQSEKA